MSNVIPGTSIVIPEPEGDWQPEGRGLLSGVHQGHVGPPLTSGREFDEDPTGPYVPGPHNQEAARVLDGVLRTLQRKGLREEKESFEQIGGQTDATTGNLVLKLHTVPSGWQTKVTLCTVDAPDSATITPSAPLANAAIFAFLAKGGGDNGGSATAMRRGLIAFAPASAGGPVIPGQWTFNERNAPIAFGGETIYYVLVGGSIAAAKAIPLQVSLRTNQYGPA